MRCREREITHHRLIIARSCNSFTDKLNLEITEKVSHHSYAFATQVTAHKRVFLILINQNRFAHTLLTNHSNHQMIDYHATIRVDHASLGKLWVWSLLSYQRSLQTALHRFNRQKGLL
jgi:hypothetical protein